MKYQVIFNAEFLYQHQTKKGKVYICVDVENGLTLSEKSTLQLMEIIKNTFPEKSHLKLYRSSINRDFSNKIKQKVNTIEFYSYIHYAEPIEEIRKLKEEQL